MNDRPDTHQKALRINLNEPQYGTFAEIGAGQEVAGWFFRVGGASGTVAKTISAYDMAVSDAIYGQSDRYVSRQRLEAMLAYEYGLTLERLQAARGSTTTFFAFADTVATRRYQARGDGHGWMGVRFQTRPGGDASEIILHVRMRDRDRDHEREALGILGVNLLYGALQHHADASTLLASLMDDLSRDRIEIDMIRCTGPAFAGVDNRVLSLQLVEKEFTDAALFTAEGEVAQPSDVLYKKSLLVARGRFRPITTASLDVLERGYEQFIADPRLAGETPLVFLEMTLQGLALERGIDYDDFLARVDLLRALGKAVIVSRYFRFFRLVEWLAGHTQKMIGLTLGVPALQDVIDAKFYDDLDAGVLESAGRTFKDNVTLYVYPSRDPATGAVITAETLPIAPSERLLHAYLMESRRIQPIRRYDPSLLGVSAVDVRRSIEAGDAMWERMVPPAIVPLIKERRLFGWHPPGAT
jgi:hypothetical protein